jgi:hypothetical protein
MRASPRKLDYHVTRVQGDHQRRKWDSMECPDVRSGMYEVTGMLFRTQSPKVLLDRDPSD